MDIHSNCVWKNKKCPEECRHPKHKEEIGERKNG